MDREGDLDVIPMDVIHEILSRSCNKSIARFGLVSKFCAFILTRPEFTELFLTRSSSNQPPRLLFATNYYSKWRLYSCPQPQSPDEDHSLIVSADFHMELLGDVGPGNIYGPVSGLLYFSNLQISKEGIDKVPVICNPCTGQYTGLPQLRSKSGEPRNLLGYDPICKQYKVLAISKSSYGEGHILTVGTGKMSWRKIQCPVNHYPMSEGICINEVLYYVTKHNKGVEVACFDVRYEKLWFLNFKRSCKLINYKGKLGVISWDWLGEPYGRRRRGRLKFYLETLEDAHNQEWLSCRYPIPVDIVV